MKPTTRFRLFFVGLVFSAAPFIQAGTLYWDVNGTTSGFSTVVGTWNTTNNSVWNGNFSLYRGTSGNAIWNHDGNVTLGGNITVSSPASATHGRPS